MSKEPRRDSKHGAARGDAIVSGRRALAFIFVGTIFIALLVALIAKMGAEEGKSKAPPAPTNVMDGGGRAP